MFSTARHFAWIAALALVSLLGNPSKAASLAPSSGVGVREAFADAQFLATLHPQARVMTVSGSSMLPYFAEGAFIVVRPIAAEALREGMVVVYRNRFGETVAHRLVAQGREGWVAKGFNNSDADSTPVTASNLMGVVYAAVHTEAQASARYAVEAGIPLALAAEAR